MLIVFSPYSLGSYKKIDMHSTCSYNKIMMAYDEDKRKINLAKHGIDLADCEPIFDAPMLTREDDRKHYGEQRLVSLGMLNGTVVVLVWTDRHTGVHVISCRKAEKYEQKSTSDIFEDVPYRANDAKATEVYWSKAIPHRGIAEFRRLRGQRGAQKAPTKKLVSVRFDLDVLETFRASGPGWQTRINAALADWLKTHSPEELRA